MHVCYKKQLLNHCFWPKIRFFLEICFYVMNVSSRVAKCIERLYGSKFSNHNYRNCLFLKHSLAPYGSVWLRVSDTPRSITALLEQIREWVRRLVINHSNWADMVVLGWNASRLPQTT